MSGCIEDDPDMGRELELEAKCSECEHCFHCMDHDELPTVPGTRVNMQCCECGLQFVKVIPQLLTYGGRT